MMNCEQHIRRGNVRYALTRISHEPERCRNKAFQPEDVVFYFEG